MGRFVRPGVESSAVLNDCNFVPERLIALGGQWGNGRQLGLSGASESASRWKFRQYDWVGAASEASREYGHPKIDVIDLSREVLN